MKASLCTGGLLLLILLLGNLVGCSSKASKARAHAERGLGAIRAGHYDEALAEYREALSLDPSSAASHHAMGFLYASRRQFERASAGYRRAVELDPDFAEAYNDLGCLAIYHTGQYAEGVALFERAIKRDPDAPLFRLNLGYSLFHLGRYAEADQAFRDALRLSPGDAHATIGLGDIAAKQGDYERAVVHYSLALKANDRNADVHRGLGLAFAKQGRYDDALTHYRLALDIDPGDPSAHFGLGDILIKTGRVAEGEREMQIFRTLGERKLDAGRVVLSSPAKVRARRRSTSVMQKSGEQVGASGERRVAPGDRQTVDFVDATDQAGLGGFRHTNGASGEYYYVETYGSGAAWLDYDGDGWLDVFVVDSGALRGYEGPPPIGNRLYRSNRDGTFTDVTLRSGLGNSAGYGMGCAVGDYDNDGDPDLYVTSFGQDVLYRNDNGVFVDVTKKAGIDNPLWGTSAAFADYDRDGDLDLYVCNYVDFSLGKNRVCMDQGKVRDYCEPSTYAGVSDVLYRNDNEVFVDVTRQAGMYNPLGKGLGVVWGDYDNDGDMDCYVANDGVANFLYRNNGDGTFTDVGVTVGAAYNESGMAEAGMGTDFGDYDNDGDLDIFVTNFAFEKNTLYRNGLEKRISATGPVAFTDVSFLCGLGQPSILKLAFGTGFFDLDNDGDLDLFTANGHVLANVEQMSDAVKRKQTNQLFQNKANEGDRSPGGAGSSAVFEDISARAGDGLKVELVSRAAVFGDYDNDGDVDILVTNNADRLTLLRNDGEKRGHWLSVRVIGARSNRDGIGTRITMTAGGNRQVREVHDGYSYLSANDPRTHFGLGALERIDLVEAKWPSGRVETFRDLPVDRFITIEEGKGVVQTRSAGH